MFDFQEYFKKGTDKIFLYFNIDEDPIYTPRFKKFLRWLTEKFFPTVLSIVSFILLIYIFNRILNLYGIEKLVIVIGVIVIFTLRGISASLKKLTE